MNRVFIHAGIITLLILAVGFYAGYELDKGRAGQIEQELDKLDLRYGDLLLQSQYITAFQNASNFCDTSIKTTLELAQVTYQKGETLEQYEQINRFSPDLIVEKQKYAMILLRLWFHSTQLKKICGLEYSTLAYFYQHSVDTSSSNLKTDQAIQSSILLDVQEECGEQNVLIFALPIDLNITVVDILKEQYNITSVPTTIIDETWKIEGRSSKTKVLEYVSCPEE